MTQRRAFQFSGFVFISFLTLAVAHFAGGSSNVGAQGATVAVPQFEYQPNMMKGTLPNGWAMGSVCSMYIDLNDHIWALTRPRELPEALRPKAAPAVLEFDPNGVFIQAWGGVPTNEHEWFGREHGIGVDPAGFVWLSGSAGTGSGVMTKPDDDMLLKFTANGKFVKQYGRQNASKGNADTANVKEATNIRYYKNEMYVSDGYGNRRLIVFDAATMTFRRMWGAFGNVPKDGPSREPGRAAGWDPGPQQFGLPHGLAISKDEKVYVADRPNRRIQAFTLQGKYLEQVVISGGKQPQEGPDGTGSVVVSPDDRFLYVGDPNAPENKTIIVVDRKTMKVIDRFGNDQTRNPHSMAIDSKGNLYIGSGGRLPRFVYKGVTQKAPSQ